MKRYQPCSCYLAQTLARPRPPSDVTPISAWFARSCWGKACRLQVEDIDSKRMVIHVRNGEGVAGEHRACRSSFSAKVTRAIRSRAAAARTSWRRLWPRPPATAAGDRPRCKSSAATPPPRGSRCGSAELRQVATCRDLHELTDYGYLDELAARHSNLKR